MDTPSSTEPLSTILPRPTAGASARYRILRQLATGGMAEILLAKTEGPDGFHKLVVLKRILPHHARDGKFVRMFLNEARLAACLHHANIAQVYELGKLDGSYYIAMEYVPGINVRQLMRHCGRTPVPLGHAIAIVAGVAAGLHYAHERRDGDGASLGLIHRDVTPSNIMVGLDGCAKLLDFGIAKATFCRSDTAPGELKGKLPYMAPELFMDQPVDRRSDIFSLGVVLYELTTGSLLFDAPRESDILHQILYRELPRPSERCAGYPRRLEEIVLQALARAPAQRFSSAHELRRALESFAREERLPVFASSLGEYASQIADTLGVADQEAPPEPATLRAAAVVVSRRRRGRRMWRALVPVTAACLLAGVALSRLGTRHRSASELAAPSPRERIVTRAPIDFAPQIVSRAAAPSRHIAPTSVSRPAIRRSKSPRPPVAATPDPPPERSWSPDSIFLPGHER